ncbi:MAG: PEP-utilizing enzyme [Candidatus Sulfobium sp.]
MANPVNICSLDYLVGTIATAYKGMVTSLVAKDFCITDEEGEITIKGTILSMPEGKYQARLMHEGSELARNDIRDGYFELEVESDLVTRAKNLQVDVVRQGRHVGTFLLKREKKGEFFFSATELSEELRGVDLKRLTAGIQEKVGLLKKAEDIVSKVLSPKKDWRKFSEKINGFASDVFWAERGTFHEGYPILTRYSRLACDKLEDDKPLSNFLYLIELPLEKEDDSRRLRGMVETWLGELRVSAADLALRPNHSRRILKAIHERFPGVDIGFAIGMLASSLKKRAAGTPAMEDEVLDSLKEVLPDSDYERLAVYGEGRKVELVRKISGIGTLPAEERYRELLEKSGRPYRDIPDETDIAEDFFAVIERNLHPRSAETIARALLKVLEGFRASSPEVSRRAAAGTAGFLRRLIGMGMADTCRTILRRMTEGALEQGEDLVLDPETARALFDAGNDDLLQFYKDILESIVIPAPRVSGFSTDTWAEIANPLHIERLRKFLKIIGLDGRRFHDVLVHVICNIYVSGVFIPDEVLFQRDVSSYLNSVNFADNFLLNHMLLQKLPVYFNEVGATGRMRDYTTEIDSWGNDTVLYFLRKQVHVNASNYNIRLVGRIMECWFRKDPGLLRGAVPEGVIGKLDAGLLSRYASAVRPFFESLGIAEGEKLHLERLTDINEEQLRRRLGEVETAEEIRSKILLLCRIYQEVVKKYSPAAADTEGNGMYERLPQHIDKMRELKGIIISTEKTAPEESLYFKRHIAFGIPSVMGSYNEPKFNAFGEFLRNEERVRVLFEKIAAEISKKEEPPGDQDLDRWTGILTGVNDLFSLFGLGNFQVEELLTIFMSNGLYLSQIADMLRLWQKELSWIVDSFHRTFYDRVTAILKVFPHEDLAASLQVTVPEPDKPAVKTADIIMRDMLGGIAGPVELDKILDGLTALCRTSSRKGADDELFRPRLADQNKMRDFVALDELGDGDAMKLAPLIGTKAKNLVYLRNRDLPVPPGVVFLSRGADDYEKYTESARFASALKKAVGRIEEKTGTSFGEGGKPLFLSVRSGSYISMPGILSSILYCGMNRKTIDAFIAATGDAWLAWDSYRRFLYHYGTVVHGLDAGVFEDIAGDFLRETGTEKGEDLEAGDMEKLAGRYRQELKGRGLKVPEDVHDQLREAIKAVYGSWHSGRADQFRKALQVSGHWGTSVILMQMVSGNGRGAGASVFFTREPSTLEKVVFGETRERATGDDLVYGRLTNLPLTKRHALERRKSLEEDDPELFSLHRDLAGQIEEAMRGLPQEVEATYVRRPDGRRLIYVLQTRRMEFHRGITKGFRDVCRMEESIIGRGTGVHGGALSGLATFISSPGQIRKMRKERNMPLILLRKSASTDDISLMPEIDGILTSAGGATSHASVLARKFDLTAVVGCSDMAIKADERNEPYAVIGRYAVTDGTIISIDGSTGLVYSGSCFPPGNDKNPPPLPNRPQKR